MLELADHLLASLKGERCIGRNHRQILVELFVEVFLGRHILHQSPGKRLLGMEPLGRQENIQCVGSTDRTHQVANRRQAITQAHLAGGDGKRAGIGGNAHIAAQRNAQSAPDAVTVNAGDGGLEIVPDGHLCTLSDALILGHGILARSQLVKLGDIGTTDESLATCSCQHHGANLIVLFKHLQRTRHTSPHVVGHGVVLGRVVECDPAGRALFLNDQAVRDVALQKSGGIAHQRSPKSDRYAVMALSRCVLMARRALAASCLRIASKICWCSSSTRGMREVPVLRKRIVLTAP